MRNLMYVIVRPLPRRTHSYVALFINIANTCFGLKKRVLSKGGEVVVLDDHVSMGKSRLDITMADMVRLEDIALAVVDQRCSWFHCLARVSDEGEVLIVDLDQLSGLAGQLFGFGDNHGDGVANRAHEVIAEHRLIGKDQPKLVMWDILAGENGKNARIRFSSAGVNANARVWVLAPQHLGVGLSGHVEIARILQVAGDLVENVIAR